MEVRASTAYLKVDYADRRCPLCIGTGKMLGGGMIYKSCKTCDGVGKIKDLMSKDGDAYKSAKKRIKALDENMTDEVAEKLLDEELGKLNEKPIQKKRGRKKDRKAN